MKKRLIEFNIVKWKISKNNMTKPTKDFYCFSNQLSVLVRVFVGNFHSFWSYSSQNILKIETKTKHILILRFLFAFNRWNFFIVFIQHLTNRSIRFCWCWLCRWWIIYIWWLILVWCCTFYFRFTCGFRFTFARCLWWFFFPVRNCWYNRDILN